MRQARLIPAGSGFAVWDRWTAKVETVPGERGRRTKLPYTLELDLELRDGRTVLTELRVGRRPNGPDITSTGLRDLPLAKVMRQTRPFVMPVAGRDEERGTTRISLGAPDDQDRAALGEVVKALSRSRPTTRDVTPEKLRLVADVYRAASSASSSTAEAIAGALHVSESYARRLVMRARRERDPETRKPYLEPAPRRRRRSSR